MLLTFFFISLTSIPQVAKCDIMDSVNSELTGDFHDTVEAIGTAKKIAFNISKALLNLLITLTPKLMTLPHPPPPFKPVPFRISSRNGFQTKCLSLREL